MTPGGGRPVSSCVGDPRSGRRCGRLAAARVGGEVMCGIIAVVRRPSDRPVPDLHDIMVAVEGATGLVPEGALMDPREPDRLERAAGRLAEVDGLLRGMPGLRCLLADR